MLVGNPNELVRSGLVQLGLNVTTDVNTTDAIDFRGASQCSVSRTSGTTGSVTVYAALEEKGDYSIVDLGGDEVAAIAPDRWNPLSADLFAHHWIKLVGDASGTLDVMGKG